jgi:hypothetical protein
MKNEKSLLNNVVNMQSSFDNYEGMFDDSKMTTIFNKHCNAKMAKGSLYLSKRLQFQDKRLCDFLLKFQANVCVIFLQVLYINFL